MPDPTPSSTDIDTLRKRHPALGFALYALEPGAPVTFEVHDDGELFAFTGPTAGAAIAEAFPPPPPPNVFD